MSQLSFDYVKTRVRLTPNPTTEPSGPTGVPSRTLGAWTDRKSNPTETPRPTVYSYTTRAGTTGTLSRGQYENR